MKKFYYVGGRKLEQSEEFFRCPAGGKWPPAWCIYPLAPSNGKNASAANFEPQGIVWNRLLHLDGAAEWSQIIVIAERTQ